jgi:hypothetical protein
MNRVNQIATCAIASCNNKSKPVTIVYILVLEIKVVGNNGIPYVSPILPRAKFYFPLTSSLENFS